MRKPIADLIKLSTRRPPGYMDEVLALASSRTATHYEISEEAWQSLTEKYRPIWQRPPKPETLHSVPLADWPKWATAFADLREPGDRGVGDTVARKLGEAGIAFKLAMKAAGAPCGCDDRRDEWNVYFPYSMLDGRGVGRPNEVQIL